MRQRTAPSGHGSLTTGAVTAVALAVQTGLAAVVGIIVARTLGRTEETDGFFAAYGVFITLALAATATRSVVMPRFVRARAERRLAGEVAAVAGSLALVIVPLVVGGGLATGQAAALLTGFGPEGARAAAAEVLPWLLAAGAGQFLAGLLASAFAALDEYVVPAVGFAGGSVAGLALILATIDGCGVVAVAWGMALNAAVAIAVPSVALALRARRERMPRGAIRAGATGDGHTARLAEAGRGVALPLALQGLYLLCLPVAARGGVGEVTSFGYAYLAGAAVVSVAASSLGLATSVPLARAGLDPAQVARHVRASSWFALLAVAATAGVFALAGEAILAALLGSGYDREVGTALGRVVVAFAPWMVVTVALTVTFPLVFVAGRVADLPRIAAATLLVHLPLAFAGQALAGLDGLAIALACSTALALCLVLGGLGAARATLVALARPTLLVAVLAAAAFLTVGLAIDGPSAAAAGLVAFAALVAALRPAGLIEAWRYLRALG
ncbi:MAG: hypothetical protein EXQ77_02015 [Thermoleophilia bacterium]|nr:hypothetical protein [Thermoleophilia bacterium]